MNVYRIQDKSGRGPYRPEFRAWKDRGHDDRNPSIFDDFPTFTPMSFLVGMSHGCGFRTIGQAQKWFTESEWLSLKSVGFQFVSMDVGRILCESKSQLLFSRAKPLKTGASTVELYPDTARPAGKGD